MFLNVVGCIVRPKRCFEFASSSIKIRFLDEFMIAPIDLTNLKYFNGILKTIQSKGKGIPLVCFCKEFANSISSITLLDFLCGLLWLTFAL